MPGVRSNFQTKIYGEIENFQPSIFLQQLDLCATVPLRAFGIVRKIGFSEDQKQKYWRDYFQADISWVKRCRQLENFGKKLLPFLLKDNSVKFDVKTAIRFLFENYGLACAE
jgi:hypothetical protein